MSKGLGHYRIVRQIGRGAMGEVYLAEDTRLERRVALKLLPPEVSSDPERRARFEREAKAAAAISHPGIVTLHSIEEAEDDTGQSVHFLTMELVDGKPLADHIEPDGTPVAQLLDWGIQLADALAAAHAAGVTHRDLKPANVMVTAEGRIKVLDFGLARGAATAANASEESSAPTSDELLTRGGQVLGTPAYMSPEQADGADVDHRTDIFSLGVILYELATGQRPFRGNSSASILSAILRDDPPPLTASRPGLPPDLERIVGRCLAKAVDQRFQTALDVRNELEELRRHQDASAAAVSRVATEVPPRARPWWRRPAPLLALIGVAAAAGLALWLGGSREPAEEEIANRGRPIAQVRPTRLTTLLGRELYPNISSDGKLLVFAHDGSGNWDIYLQRVGGSKPIALTADHAGDDTTPALSPDDQRIAFRSERDGGGLFVMGATGESVRQITDFGYNPSWSPDGSKLVFCTELTNMFVSHIDNAEIWIVDVVSGERHRVEGAAGFQPAWSPNGHRIAYTTLRKNRRREVVTIPATGGQPTPVTDARQRNRAPVWSPDGRHLHFTDGDRGFARVAIDERSGKVLGEPEPVLATMGTEALLMDVSEDFGAWSVMRQRTSIEAAEWTESSETSSAAHRVILRETVDQFVFDLSADGTTLLAASGSDPWTHFKVRTDGTEVEEIAKEYMWSLRWSPDGERISAIADIDETGYEVHTMRPDGSGLKPVTERSDSFVNYPVWSPDGRRIVYWHQETDRAYAVDPDAPGPVHLGDEIAGGEGLRPGEFSADGSQILGHRSGGGIVLLDLETAVSRQLTDEGIHPRWLGSDAVAFVNKRRQVLERYDLQTGEVTTLVAPERATDIEFYFAVGESEVYHVCFDSQVEIWGGPLE